MLERRPIDEKITTEVLVVPVEAQRYGKSKEVAVEPLFIDKAHLWRIPSIWGGLVL
jgi:hypothetical protein